MSAFGLAVFFFSFSAAIASYPVKVESFLNAESVSEDGVLSNVSGNQDAFLKYINLNWQKVVKEDLKNETNTRRTQVLFAGGETMSGPTYLLFMNEVCDQIIIGNLSSKLLTDSALSVSNAKIGFLARNYSDYRVVELLEKMKSILSSDPYYLKVIPEIISGNWLDEAANATLGRGLPAPEKLVPPLP